MWTGVKDRLDWARLEEDELPVRTCHLCDTQYHVSCKVRTVSLLLFPPPPVHVLPRRQLRWYQPT